MPHNIIFCLFSDAFTSDKQNIPQENINPTHGSDIVEKENDIKFELVSDEVTQIPQLLNFMPDNQNGESNNVIYFVNTSNELNAVECSNISGVDTIEDPVNESALDEALFINDEVLTHELQLFNLNINDGNILQEDSNVII